MATTVTLSSQMVNEVKALTGARTKTEAVRDALSEYIRARRRQELLGLAGKVAFRLTNKQIEGLESE
ncbi:type II toxin-antitoxin system VapB family antitoxin [Acidobacteria bacterium AH-259-G07]|nr:type II toxin-antitoxin system VapB family antitoxin [Acidobacteria bacterium AH-259-G07]